MDSARAHRNHCRMAVPRGLTARTTAVVSALLLTACSASPTPPEPPAPSPTVVQRFTQAQQVPVLRIEMRTLVRSGIVPGIVVLIRHGDRERVLTDGLADTRPRTRMAAGDRFRVASITKPMVAALAMRLVEAGRMGLEDPVEKWLPGLLPSTSVTVGQLLAHTSGLADYEDLPAARAVLRQAPVDPRELVAVAAHAPPVFAPGQGQQYSNTNYQVLGLVIERVGGASLESMLDREILIPLGMTSASLSRARWTQEPLAHGFVDGRDVTRTDLSPGWAAGGLVSDAADVSTFFRALLGNRLVPAPRVAEMVHPAAQDMGVYSGYGLGLGELATSCGSAVGHFGAWDGYSSAAFTRPDTDHEVVLLVNASRDLATGPLQDILDTALCGP